MLAVGFGGFVAFLLFSSPPIDAALNSGAPSPNHSLWLSGPATSESPYLTGLLSSIALASDHHPEAGGPEEPEQEIVLPVPSRTCERIAAALGAGCDRPPPRPLRGGHNLTLEFSRPVLVGASTREPARLRLDFPSLPLPTPSPTAWTLDLDAGLATLDVRCYDGARFLIFGAGIGASAGACVDGAPAMRIRVAAGDSPEIEMREMRVLRLAAESRAAGAVVDTGLLRVGDTHTPVRDGGGTGLSLRSESSAGVAVGLEVTSRPPRSDLTLDARAAASVLERGDEKVPSLFSRQRELWLAVIFAAIALVATLWSDAFVLWR